MNVVDKVTSQSNVALNISTRHEASLFLTDEIGKEISKSIIENLGEDFVEDITKADGTKVFNADTCMIFYAEPNGYKI